MIVNNIKNRLRPLYSPILSRIRKYKKNSHIRKEVKRIKWKISSLESSKAKVFYLGITAHSNLGDMAQYYCIKKWIGENYRDYSLIEVEADTVVSDKHDFLSLLKSSYRLGDIIVFQSGYTTQDLGGVHDLMHRQVIEALPDAHILMMPQTIYFQHEENRQRSARIYNSAHNMLFLARDKVSYKMALEMMPDVIVELFPDIVTSLIGKYSFDTQRHGFNICRRNDGEKYYSDEELAKLAARLAKLAPVTFGDTTVKVPFKELRRNTQHYIEKQIKEYSHYEVVITDRYHGTIFALAAGTPVIILKTTDHKVVTGADWFKGIYDDYVYVAEDLDDVYRLAMSILNRNLKHSLTPYFANHYFNTLYSKLESKVPSK